MKKLKPCSGRAASGPRSRKQLVLSHGMALVTLLGTGFPVIAVGSQAQIEEVVVTARRKEESLQKVPISVSAISGGELDNRGFNSLTDIQKSAPNLAFTTGQGGNSGGVSAFIRGVGESDFLLTSDPAVALYIDGVYIARSYGATTQLLDIDRVEVLRGPQGSLFGKNTIGGAINVSTRLPDGGRDIQADLRLGSYDSRQLRASGQMPLSDELALGLSYLNKKADGWQKLDSGGTQANENVQAARAALRWLHDDIDAALSVDGLHQHQNGSAHSMIAFTPTLFSGLYSGFVAPCCEPDAHLGRTDADRRLSRDDADVLGASFTLRFPALGGTVKSITGARQVSADFGRDGDGSSRLNYAGEIHDEHARQYSQELQFARNFHDDKVQTLFGVYAFSEIANDHTILYTAEGLYEPLRDSGLVPDAGALDFNVDFKNRQKTTNYALFGNVTLALSDAFSLDLGGRYTYEKKQFRQRATRIYAKLPLLGDIPEYELDENWSAFTPKAVLSYQFDPETMGYFSLSQGFRSGGFNGRPTSPQEIGSYDPEKLTSAEIGLKTQLFDNRLRINSDIYYNRYKDMQLSVSSAGEGGIPFVRTENAGEAEMFGFESEVTAVLNTWLTLDGSIGYLHAKYLEYVSGGVDSTKLHIKQAPRWTGALGGTLTLPVSERLETRLRVDMAYKDSIYIDAQNSDRLRAPSHALWNASLTFDVIGTGLQFALSGENLSNKQVLNAGFDATDSFGFVEGYYNAPRRWFVSVRYRH